ncbi:MAG: hypothetical protein JJLCMIEE_00723 [Acidimicrobiales bacterium]|nr:MAG: CDGSH iron-sulfur domain-containing protein [Actinomycetota bacterium]MBV6507668.1 hypothetical protein [Acidimicrobiales bacterium]RIK07682.1 MAG: iron-binding protein [Acidobacteriota bacterium]
MSQATIKVRADGPYKVTGDFVLTDHEGNIIETGDDIVLCRCGHSDTKPFCDRSHKEIGFRG